MPPQVFIGAAANPFAAPMNPTAVERVEWLAAQVAAGAAFVHTLHCFDVPHLEECMREVRERGLHERCAILVGVGPLDSPRAARWIREHMPGVYVPEHVIERLEHADRPRLEGQRICIELIQQVREISGINGVHLMAYRQEEAVAEIIDASGVLSGRMPWNPSERSGTFLQRASS